MNWYSVFYWLAVSDNVKKFFDTTSNIFSWFTVLLFIVVVISSISKGVTLSSESLKTPEEDIKNPELRAWEAIRKYSIRLFYPMLVLALISWFGYMAVPTKKDCLMIIAGGAVGTFITTDSSAKALPADMTSYLHLALQKEIKDLGAETRAELGLQTPKEKFLEKAKNLTKDELMELFLNDSTLKQ